MPTSRYYPHDAQLDYSRIAGHHEVRIYREQSGNPEALLSTVANLEFVLQ